MKIPTPNFKITLSTIGIAFMFMAISLFAKGLIPSMAEFKVPQETLSSPHYIDAISWVYIHMTVIGALIFLLGRSVTDLKHQISITLFLIAAIIFYSYLDFRSSDSPLGNGLYKGDASIVPGIINIIVLVFLILLSVNLFRNKNNEHQ